MIRPFLVLANIILFTNVFNSVKAQTVNFMPAELIAEPGEQKNNNTSTGTTESLRVSTSSTFGSSTSVSTTEGFTINSKALLRPKSATIKGGFGGDDGEMKVDVGNIRSEGSGEHSAPDGNGSFNIDADKSTITEGFSNVKGITSEIDLNIDSENTNTEVLINDIAGTTSTMKTANGSANQSLSNSLTVDISNSTFNSAFSQAF